MELKGKHGLRIAEFVIMIAVPAVLSIGCADNPQSGGLETNISEIAAFETETSETQAFNMETFNTESPGNDDMSEEDISVGDVHLYEREDKIRTMFYDLQIDKVTITDSIGGITAESGREFMALDVTITACGDEKVISMYAQEFLMVCFLGESVKADSEEDYEKLYPLEEGLEEGQLGDVWLAVEGEDIKGKLIYNIPKDAIRMVLLVYDSYTTGDLNEMVFGDGYMITIPEENWDREE